MKTRATFAFRASFASSIARADALTFDDLKLKRIYASCGDGVSDVIDQRDRDHYELRERIQTRAGARTSFFSRELN